VTSDSGFSSIRERAGPGCTSAAQNFAGLATPGLLRLLCSGRSRKGRNGGKGIAQEAKRSALRALRGGNCSGPAKVSGQKKKSPAREFGRPGMNDRARTKHTARYATLTAKDAK